MIVDTTDPFPDLASNIQLDSEQFALPTWKSYDLSQFLEPAAAARYSIIFLPPTELIAVLLEQL